MDTWMQAFPLDGRIYSPGKIQNTFFILCFLALAAFLIYLTWAPTKNRHYYPVESDDSMTYLIKAVQMEACYFQDCRALEDMRQQLTLPSSGNPKYARDEAELFNIFPQYTHAHAFMIWVTKRVTGLSWVDSFNAVRTLGALFMAVAIAYWLLHLFGPTAAGLTLILLIGLDITLPGHAISAITPFNLSMALSMLLWGVLIHHRGNVGGWLPLMVFLPNTFHPLAIGFSGVTLGVFLFLRGPPWRQRDLLFFTLALIILILLQELSFLIDRPVIGLYQSFGVSQSSTGFTLNLWVNADMARMLARNWMQPFGLGIATTTCMVGMVAAAFLIKKRSAFPLFLLFITGLCGAAFFYHAAATPGDVFIRFWNALAILLTGVTAVVILIVPGMALFFYPYFSKGIRLTRQHRIFRPGLAVLILVTIGFSVVLIPPSFAMVHYGLSILPVRVTHLSQRMNYPFDPSQVTLLHDPLQPCDIVLYIDLPFYQRDAWFTEGALECGALFLNVLQSPEGSALFDEKRNRITHVVFPNLVHTHPHPISITKAGVQIWFWKVDPVASWRMLLKNPGTQPAQMQLSTTHTQDAPAKVLAQFIVAPGEENWYTSPLPHLDKDQRLTLQMVTDGDIHLNGLRMGADSKTLRWPWDQGIGIEFSDYRMVYTTKKDLTRRQTRFTLAELDLQPNLMTEVIDDRGSNALAITTQAPSQKR